MGSYALMAAGVANASAGGDETMNESESTLAEFVENAAKADLRDPDSIFRVLPGSWKLRDNPLGASLGVTEYEAKQLGPHAWFSMASLEMYSEAPAAGVDQPVDRARLMLTVND